MWMEKTWERGAPAPHLFLLEIVNKSTKIPDALELSVYTNGPGLVNRLAILHFFEMVEIERFVCEQAESTKILFIRNH